MHHPSATPLRRIGVVSGAYSQRTAAESWSLRADALHLLWIIDDGWRIDGKRLEFPWLWIIPSGPTDRRIASPAGRQLLWFTLAPRPRWAHLAEEGPHRRDPGGGSQPDATHQVAKRWMSEAYAPWIHADRIAAGLGDALAAILERRLHALAGPRHLRHLALLDGLRQDVRRDPRGPWPLSRLCRQARCSPSQLHRICLMHTGLSPVRLAADLRLQFAADLLQGGDRTIDQVADVVGYGSAAALSKAFVRRFGRRPGTRRR